MPDWSSDVCFVIGGGPSVAQLDAERLRAPGRRVIGVNEAGLTVAPWCDVLLWADRRWLEWNRARLSLHTGWAKVHRHSGVVSGAFRMKFRPGGLCLSQDALGGHDCGSSAINLAYHFRCRRIVLLGFECMDVPMDRWQEGNFHRQHLLPPLPGQRAERFVPAHQRMSRDIAARGIRVYNATPVTALECWPRVDLEEALSWT